VNDPSAIPESDRALADVIDGLSEYLRYQKEIGVEELEVDGAVLTHPGPVAKPQVQATPDAPPPPRIEQPPPTDAKEALSQITERIAACTQCALCEGRQNTVPGQGTRNPDILFVGEGPGADEDRQGLAFVGRAGQLLTRMIVAMGLSREEVFIANVVKCRPPGNRNPYPQEMSACVPYLEEQIEVLKPRVIVALGATAIKGLLGDERISITRMRGSWMHFKGIDLMPTFHPAYLLRNPDAKKDVWKDLQEVLQRIGRKPPP
jgi:DNA polymerase